MCSSCAGVTLACSSCSGLRTLWYNSCTFVASDSCDASTCSFFNLSSSWAWLGSLCWANRFLYSSIRPWWRALNSCSTDSWIGRVCVMKLGRGATPRVRMFGFVLVPLGREVGLPTGWAWSLFWLGRLLVCLLLVVLHGAPLVVMYLLWWSVGYRSSAALLVVVTCFGSKWCWLMNPWWIAPQVKPSLWAHWWGALVWHQRCAP